VTTPQTSASASTSSASTQNLYYDFCLPLGLKDLILDIIEGNQSNPNTPQIPSPTTSQMWFSQPRPGTDPTTEVLTVNFKEPVTISELTWDTLRVGVYVEVWYQDRNNNWTPVLDTTRNPIVVNLSNSSVQAWYTANYTCYQVIAKALQWRFTRVYDITIGTTPYVVGMRNGLIQRNIYNRSDGTQGIDTQQDVVGNTITSYIQDWDASQAIDDDPNTFWRSLGQPDPNAVTWIGLDCRAPNGNPQLIDTLYIDPVYTGQTLNIYYSNDDTIGTLKLSPVTALPTVNENTNWVEGTGLIDISTGDATSDYEFPMSWGPLVSQDAWIGMEWAPDFAAGLTNAIQDISINNGPTGGTFTLTYGGHTTTGITYNAAATTVQAALQALASIGSGNVVITGPAGGPYVATFQGSLAGESIATMTSNASGLTGGIGTVSITITTTTVGGEGDGPAQNPVLFRVTPLDAVGVDAEQVIAFVGTPTGGTFTLTYSGQTTGSLAYDVTAAEIQTALQALSSIGTNNVLVAGADGDGKSPWFVTFTAALSNQSITTMTAASALTGTGTVGISVNTSTPGEVEVVSNVVGQYCPTIYYDVGAGEFVLELTDGVTVQTYNCPVSPLFSQYVPLRIVVGWGYTPQTVFMSIATPDGTVLGSLTNTSPNLPPLMTLDGSIGFEDFAGTFTAHVIKLENWSIGQASFQSNPSIYVSPDPVQPDASGNIPATTLDNSIYAAAWTMQDNGTGGSHATAFASKSWTPILSNYFTDKGNLFFPQQISLKYLKLEMTNLTEEYYPVYDSGIPITYDVFPPSVTQASPNTANSSQTNQAAGLLSVGSDVVLSGVGSVNWLNPSTVNNAVNSVYGQTVTPVTVTNTPGYNSTTTLPNTTALDLANQTRQEVSSSWVYTRSPMTATTMAAQTISTAASSVASQGLTTSTATISTQVASNFNPSTTSTPSSTSLPTQGTDWWVFPGATLRLPANVMTGLTNSTTTVTSARMSTETRLRFNSTCVHYYTQQSAVRDATLAYYAGLREIQPYVTTYIAGQDPDTFTFTRYDPSQWVLTNINSLVTGPITTAGASYTLVNGNFDTDINNWTQTQGTWFWNGTTGHWDYGSASVTADGTEKELVSDPLDVVPGAEIDTSVWVSWEGLTATADSEAIQLQALFYDGGTYVSSLAVGLTYSTWASSTPDIDGNFWAQIVASQATENGFTVPDGVNIMMLALVVTPAATAGQVNFDTVLVGTATNTEGTAYKDFETTASFSRLQCTFQDSGLVRSDDMWAQEDPLDTNISSTALAYYTSTIPDVIPAGMWADTFGDWESSTITWGEPRSEVAINVDPNRVYDGKRVLHFSRAAGAEEAGILVRQITNFTSNGLFRLGCVFFKPTANANQITIQLRRVSDGVYIYTEVFTPVVGYWYEYITNFIEIPESEDQEYTVEFLLTGDAADEMYLNDLYCDIALIRYFVQLGGADEFNHDVTALAYSDTAIVSCTTPVTEFSCDIVIVSPDAYAYGAEFQPTYLQ
jgi:hypothetical protein